MSKYNTLYIKIVPVLNFQHKNTINFETIPYTDNSCDVWVKSIHAVDSMKQVIHTAIIPYIKQHIGGVMVNVLPSSVVDRGFEPCWVNSNQRLEIEHLVLLH